MAFMYETVTTRSGGLATTDIADLNQALRCNINSRPLRDRSSSETGHPELVAVSAHFLRSASSARAASVP
jgi:hypothetical protein